MTNWDLENDNTSRKNIRIAQIKLKVHIFTSNFDVIDAIMHECNYLYSIMLEYHPVVAWVLFQGNKKFGKTHPICLL